MKRMNIQNYFIQDKWPLFHGSVFSSYPPQRIAVVVSGVDTVDAVSSSVAGSVAGSVGGSVAGSVTGSVAGSVAWRGSVVVEQSPQMPLPLCSIQIPSSLEHQKDRDFVWPQHVWEYRVC